MKTGVHRHFLRKQFFMAIPLMVTTGFSHVWASNDDLKDSESNITKLIGMSLEELMEVRIVTIATGVEQTTMQAAAMTTVITAEDIEAMGTTELSEVLQSVPGLYVRRSSVFYQATYVIRGISSNFNPEVLVMMNGVPISQLVIGGSRRPIWDAPRLRDIARIEIIRGPGSAVYGADAYSGVINIITKKAKEIDGTKAGVRVGSFDTQEAWLLHGGKYQGIDFSLSLQAYRTEGSDKIIAADAQTIYDRQLGTHASATPGPANLQRDVLDVRTEIGQGNWLLHAGYQGRYHVGRGVSNTIDPLGLSEDNRYNIDLTWHNPKFTDYWDMTAQVSYQTLKEWPENNFYDSLPGAARQQRDGSTTVYPYGRIFSIGFAERHSRAEFSSFYTGWPDHLLRIGTGYHHADNYENLTQTNVGLNPYTGKPIPPDSLPVDVSGTSAAINATGTRSNWHVYLQDVWKLTSSWELTTGIRYDDYSDFGQTTNPRLALVKQFSDNFTGKLLYGKAFRAPSLSELTTTNTTTIIGTATLKPETIETWELATEWQVQAKLQLSADLFFYEATDKIGFVVASGQNATAVAQNTGIQRGHGLELETRWQMNSYFNLLAHYAYQKSTDEIKDMDMGYAPHHKVYLRGDWFLTNNWHLYPQVLWIGERNHSVGDSRPPLNDYTLVDLTLRYKPVKEKSWNFTAGVYNVFDTDARDSSVPNKSLGQFNLPDEIPLAGRRFFIELGYRF